LKRTTPRQVDDGAEIVGQTVNEAKKRSNVMFEIPEVRVGEPCACGSVTVFPLYTRLSGGVLDYVVAYEALAQGSVEVREVSEDGAVGTVLVANGGDQPVLFMDGEELVGAKQNRTVATSVLIAAGSRTRIPVCCIQRGRWAYSSRHFSSGSCCPPTLRRLLKEGDGRVAGTQTAVWQEIRRKHEVTGTRSEKENLSDALDVHRGSVEDLQLRLRYPQGTAGIAVALGDRLVSVDIFDRAETLEKMWDRLVQGVALDALEFPATARQAEAPEVAVRLYMMRNMRWSQVATVGIGEAYRAQDNDGTLGTALVMDGMPVHLSLSMPM
jgi:hypothetical protein